MIPLSRRASNLQLRGNVYWLRLRVPDALRGAVGKTEIRKSLGTGDYREAQQRARLERVKIDGEWNALRRQLAPEAVTSLSEQEIWYLASKWFVETERRNVEQGGSWRSLDEAERELGALSEPFNMEPVAYQEAKKLLSKEGLDLSPDTDAWRRLVGVLGQGLLEAEKREVRRNFPSAPIALDPQFADLNALTTLQPAGKFTVAQLLKAYRSDPSRAPMSRKTRLKREAQWQAISEFFGADTPVTEVSRDRVRAFMSLLQKLPSNATKHFPGRTIFEAAAMGAERNLPVLAVDTANDYLRTLGSLFRFALHEGKLSKDPTAGLLLRPEKKVKAKDKRLPFTTGELCAIFSAPLFVGCMDDEYGYSKPGPRVVRRGRFWVPLVALFTGMRLNEVCQLTLDDFVRQDGTDIILIRGDDDDETKRVKTEAGNRFVPVHPELRRIGLLAFVDERRRSAAPNASLFPELSVGVTGYRSDPFSKFFARFLDHVGISERRKVFHSLRHNYRDALREADISQEKVRALGGWSSGRTEDDYGSGLRPSTLAAAIEAVGYPGLDLSHLHR